MTYNQIIHDQKCLSSSAKNNRCNATNINSGFLKISELCSIVKQIIKPPAIWGGTPSVFLFFFSFWFQYNHIIDCVHWDKCLLAGFTYRFHSFVWKLVLEYQYRFLLLLVCHFLSPVHTTVLCPLLENMIRVSLMVTLQLS